MPAVHPYQVSCARGCERPVKRTLSPDPQFDGQLSRLLDIAIPCLRELTADLSPAALLLMGSASVGEAIGVRAGERYLPLSDLDLALFLDTPISGSQVAGLRSALSAALTPEVEAQGLAHDPVDLGVYSAPYLARLPITLELIDAAREPQLLWEGLGATLLSRCVLERPPPFEALRLVMNRIVEIGSAPPAPTDWHEAHRWSKLILDSAKAHLAFRGHHSPAFAGRLALLDQLKINPGIPREALSEWAAWRTTPVWPPPAVPLRDLACSAATLLGEMLADGATPRGVLSLEGGAARERLRRWRLMLASRPPEIGALAALRFALDWGMSAWPASLAILAYSVNWMETAGAPLPPGIGSLIARRIPMCHATLVDWSRAAGAW